MVHAFIDGTYRVTNLTTESAEYLAKREGLLRISRKEGHRFTASRSMVSRHAGPLLVK